MVDIVEELADVALEKVALSAMLFIVLMQEAVEAVHGKEGALVLPAGGVVVDQVGLEIRGKDIVAEAVLEDAVAVVEGIDLPGLRVMDGEVVIAGEAVSTGLQFLPQSTEIGPGVQFELYYFPGTPLAPAGSLVGGVEVIEIKDLFVGKFFRGLFYTADCKMKLRI